MRRDSWAGSNERDGEHNHGRECRVRVGSWAMEVLRHELPDQQVLDRRIIAGNGLIAPRVTMSCRLLLRRVASRGVLPRERFRFIGPNSDLQ